MSLIFRILYFLATAVTLVVEAKVPSQIDPKEISSLTCVNFFAKLNSKSTSLNGERDKIVTGLGWVLEELAYLLSSSQLKNKTLPSQISMKISDIRESWKMLNFTTFAPSLTCTGDENERSFSLRCLALPRQLEIASNFSANLERLKTFSDESVINIRQLAKDASEQENIVRAAERSNSDQKSKSSMGRKWRYVTEEFTRLLRTLEFYAKAFTQDCEKISAVEAAIEKQLNATRCIDDQQRKSPENITALLFEDATFAINTSTLLYDGLFIKFKGDDGRRRLIALSGFLTANFSLASFICRCGFGEFFELSSSVDFKAVSSYFNVSLNFADVWMSPARCVNISDDEVAEVAWNEACYADGNGSMEYGLFCEFHEAVVRTFYRGSMLYDAEADAFSVIDE